jgi:pimeloyl-ACP methyl ester carboxylesterase
MARDLEQEARNKALVLEAFDALFNRRDFEAAERYWSQDYVQRGAGIGISFASTAGASPSTGTSCRTKQRAPARRAAHPCSATGSPTSDAATGVAGGSGFRTRNSERPMSSTTTASNTTAPTQLLKVNDNTYAYRRFGSGSGLPLLLLQHFTGTLDNWDPAVTDPLAAGREVILFDSAGLGRSSGEVPPMVAAMARHPMAFLEALGIERCDVLGYSLGGMVALQMVQDRPSIFRRMILVGTAPRGGEDIMHLEKPSLARRIQDPTNRGYDVLKKIFFAPSPSSQAAGEAFIRRLSQRKDDLDPVSGPKVASAQIAAFREWEQFKGERFAELRGIRHPALVVNGVGDEMIPIANSYRLCENLPNAVLLTYPDAGHGSLFQYPESFTRHAATFLASDAEWAAF